MVQTHALANNNRQKQKLILKLHLCKKVEYDISYVLAGWCHHLKSVYLQTSSHMSEEGRRYVRSTNNWTLDSWHCQMTNFANQCFHQELQEEHIQMFLEWVLLCMWLPCVICSQNANKSISALISLLLGPHLDLLKSLSGQATRVGCDELDSFC